MLKLLVKVSPVLQSFLQALKLSLSKPQRKHLMQISEAIILCNGKKTLSSLNRLMLDAPDVSASADFLRESPWNYELVRKSLAKFTIEYAIKQAEKEYNFKPEMLVGEYTCSPCVLHSCP